MAEEYTYRDSHKYADKGAEYEAYYETQAWQRFLWSREQKVILRILEKYYGDKDIDLLDFACGTGRVTSFLENRVRTSTGVDVSGSMLAIARKKLKRTEVIEGDITSADVLQGREFNLITAFRFFLNAEPELRLAAIKALAGLLAKDGCLVFNNHRNLGSPWIKWSCMRRHQKNLQGTYNVMTVTEMKELVKNAGLEIIEIYPIGFLHPPRIKVPQMFVSVIEDMSCNFKCLSRFSESPIAVCGWARAPEQFNPV